MSALSTSRFGNQAGVRWHPTAEEVAAIVAEMRPVIDSLAAREAARLDCLERLQAAHAGASGAARRPAAGGRTIRGLEVELGHDVLVGLLNENSFNPRRRATTVQRKLTWAHTVATRRRHRQAA